MTPSPLVELTLVAPCGLLLALTRRRLGYPSPALTAWVVLGAAAVAGLLGPFDIGVQAILASIPVWVVAWRLARRPPAWNSLPRSYGSRAGVCPAVSCCGR